MKEYFKNLPPEKDYRPDSVGSKHYSDEYKRKYVNIK